MAKPITIVSIGAGNIAHHLIPALAKLDCEIVQVYSRTLKSAKKLGKKVNSVATNKLEKLIAS